MKLVNIDDCNRELFYKQMGGKNNLITVETAFNMLMSLPVVTGIKIDMNDDLVKEIRRQTLDDAIEYFSKRAHYVHPDGGVKHFVCDRLERMKGETNG